MKKSILMAIVALALLAAPAFAGDYSIVGNIDVGWGWALGNDTEDTGLNNTNTFVNDFTMLGFFGSVDPNNSLAIQMEYGTTGSGLNINAFDAHTSLDARGLSVLVTEFSLTTNILGSFGLTDLPVTLFMTNGFGRANLHNRFQQWTGWEIKRWKDNGAAHFAGDWSGSGFDPAAWERVGYMKLQAGIMNMVNVAFSIVPLAGSAIDVDPDLVDVEYAQDIPVMIDVWTNGIAVGPAALDICANLRADDYEIITGAQVTANMSFDAIGLLAYLGVDYRTSTNTDMLEGSDFMFAAAVKPSFNFGAGSVALGAWMTLNTLTDGYTPAASPEDSYSIINLAFDLSASFSTFTVYGGVIMFDITDAYESELATTMKWDIGVKNSFGAATIGVGIAGVVADAEAAVADVTGVTNGYDLGAADGSAQTWAWTDGTDGVYLPTMYFRVTAWY